MYDQIVSLIGKLGFPIACCIVLFVQQNKLTDTLTKLTVTLETMSDRIDDLEKKVEK